MVMPAPSKPKYGHSRVSCMAGYLDFPCINSSMAFDLKQFPCLSARIVRTNRRVFELWSPNSQQFPFLPGERGSQPATRASMDVLQRRYDGHTGKHDCLYSPQYFLDTTSHWAFIRRVSAVPPGDLAHPAYQSLIDGWVCSPRNPSEGVWDSQFVQGLRGVMSLMEIRMRTLQSGFRAGSSTWAARPAYCTEARLQVLLGVRRWDDAVDLGVAFQWGLREQEAWIEMVKARRKHTVSSIFDLREAKLPVADDDRIGLWINGMDEQGVLLLMKQKVPCFIVHEFPSQTLIPRSAVPEPPSFSNFMEGTDVVHLVMHGAYQALAEDLGRLDSIFRNEDGRGAHVPPSREDEARSSSLYLTALPAWEPRPRPSYPRMMARSSRQILSELSSTEESDENSCDEEDDQSDSNTPPPPSVYVLPDRFAAPDIERRVIDPDRVAWIVPPVIPSNWNGRWLKWELDEVNGERAWVYRGQQVEVESNPWYDRVLGRRLYFGRFDPPPGLFDWVRFGSPVPRYPFFTESGNRWVPKTPSHWMYQSEKGETRDRGRRAEAPVPSRLPLVHRGEPKRESAEERGKVIAGEEDVGMLDIEELSEDGDGMDVDDFKAEGPASNVVTIADVNDDISAQNFRALAADAFSQSNAYPLSIVRAQGLIWIRFEDVTAGRRGFGAMGVVWKKMKIAFRHNGEFDEAASFTTDIWVREGEVIEDGPAPPYTPAVVVPVVAVPPPLTATPIVSASSATLGWPSTEGLDWTAMKATTSTVKHKEGETLPMSATAAPEGLGRSQPPRLTSSAPEPARIVIAAPEPRGSRTARPPPTAPIAMRDKGKGKPPPLRSPSPPRRSPTLSPSPRLGDPPRRVPLVQRSTSRSTESTLPLAARIAPPSLHSRLQRGPPDDVMEQKRARDEEVTHEGLDYPPKKKMRGSRSGRGQQRRRKAQSAREARAPALSTMPPPPALVSSETTVKENAPLNGALAPSASTSDTSLVASELSPEASSTATARSHSVQPADSSSRVRLEDMEDGDLEEEQVREWLNDDEPMGPTIF